MGCRGSHVLNYSELFEVQGSRCSMSNNKSNNPATNKCKNIFIIYSRQPGHKQQWGRMFRRSW